MCVLDLWDLCKIGQIQSKQDVSDFRIIFSEIFHSDVQNQNRKTPPFPTYRLKNAIEFPILYSSNSGKK